MSRVRLKWMETRFKLCMSESLALALRSIVSLSCREGPYHWQDKEGDAALTSSSRSEAPFTLRFRMTVVKSSCTKHEPTLRDLTIGHASGFDADIASNHTIPL